MSDVTPSTSPTTQNNPNMTITNFNHEGSYLPCVICNIIVKADLGRSASKPIPQCIMGYILWDVLGAMLDSSRKDGKFILFLNNRLVNSQLALYSHFNYEGSYLPGVICNIVVKADLGRWTPQWIENRCLEYCYTKLGRQTYFG